MNNATERPMRKVSACTVFAESSGPDDMWNIALPRLVTIKPSNTMTSTLTSSMIHLLRVGLRGVCEPLGRTLAPDGSDNGARPCRHRSNHGSHQQDEPTRQAIRLEQTPHDTEGCRDQEEGLCDFHGASLRVARCTGKTQIDSPETNTVAT